MNKTNAIKGYLMVIISAVIYGCMPLMSKYIYEDGVNPATLVLLRNFLALPSLAILGFMQNKTLKITPKALPSIGLLASMGCCVTPLLLFTSYNYMENSGTATVLHFVYPAVVVVGGIIFLRQKVKLGNIISVAICVAGIALFYDPSASVELEGCLLALSSGVTFAIYVLFLPKFKFKEIKGFLFSFYIALVSSVLMLVYCLATKSIVLPETWSEWGLCIDLRSAFVLPGLPETWKGWGLCILFALAITTGAVVLFQQGTFVIGSERASILSTLEPITSVVVGIVILHETQGPRTIVGSVLVVIASILIAIFDMKKSKSEN